MAPFDASPTVISAYYIIVCDPINPPIAWLNPLKHGRDALPHSNAHGSRAKFSVLIDHRVYQGLRDPRSIIASSGQPWAMSVTQPLSVASPTGVSAMGA